MHPLFEELTSRTIRPSDKYKVARLIGDMLGVEDVEKMSPDMIINQALRQLRTKRMTPEFIDTLRNMLSIAQHVGIKVNQASIPSVLKTTNMKEEQEPGLFQVIGDLPPKNVLDAQNTMPTIKRLKRKHRLGEAATRRADERADEPAIIPAQEPTYSATYSPELPTSNPERKKTKSGRLIPVGNTLLRGIEGKSLTMKEGKELDDEELDQMASTINDDDIMHIYSPDEFDFIDSETSKKVDTDKLSEDTESEVISEVLSRAERIKAKIRFMRTKALRARKLKIALKKHSPMKVLIKRARRLAIKKLKERFSKKSLNEMSVSEKERIEKMLQSKKGLIDRLALRLLPQIKKIESERLSHKQES